MAKLSPSVLHPQKKSSLICTLPQISQLNWACLIAVVLLASFAIAHEMRSERLGIGDCH